MSVQVPEKSGTPMNQKQLWQWLFNEAQAVQLSSNFSKAQNRHMEEENSDVFDILLKSSHSNTITLLIIQSTDKYTL